MQSRSCLDFIPSFNVKFPKFLFKKRAENFHLSVLIGQQVGVRYTDIYREASNGRRHIGIVATQRDAGGIAHDTQGTAIHHRSHEKGG